MKRIKDIALIGFLIVAGICVVAALAWTHERQ